MQAPDGPHGVALTSPRFYRKSRREAGRTIVAISAQSGSLDRAVLMERAECTRRHLWSLRCQETRSTLTRARGWLHKSIGSRAASTSGGTSACSSAAFGQHLTVRRAVKQPTPTSANRASKLSSPES